MTEAPIDQIEFRWDPDYDLTAIASSFRTDEESKGWTALLQQYAGVSARGGTAAAEAPSSAVYLDHGDGMAALILRSRDPDAKRLHDSARGPSHGAGANRLNLVARALIGPRNALTAEVAMRIAASGPRAVLNPAPGQVGRREALPPLYLSFLRRSLAPHAGLQQRAKNVQGLAPVIAAVLGNPGRPVTVVLGADDISSPLWQSRSLSLLWASRVVLQPVLSGTDGFEDGWRPSFSTCEAPQSPGDGRGDIWLTFRDRGLDGPPLGDAPYEVHLDRAGEVQGALGSAAGLLADAYRTDGDQCAKLIEWVVRGHGSVEDRIDAIACSREITDIIDDRPVRNVQPVTRPVREPGARTAPARRPTAPAPVAATAEASTPPHPPVPRRGDRYLVGLYQMLGVTDERRRFLRTMNWIAARAATGAGLDRAGFSAVLHIMDHHGWFADRLDGLTGAPELMADLMYPLFAAGLGDQELEDQLRRRHLNGTLPPVMADALGIMAARLDPDRADWLAEHCLGYAFPARRPDSFGDAAGAHPRPGRESPVLTVLRRPSRNLPAGVADALVWLSPVLLLIVAYLALV